MTRTGKCFGGAALLTAALAMTAAAADPEPGVKPDAAVELLRELKASSEKMQKQLDDITAANLKTQKALQDAAAMRQELDELKTQMAQVQKRLDDLNRTAPRISAYGPTPPTTGRIVLRNDYPTTISVLLNSNTYQLAAGAAYAIENQPAGPFTYQVLGVQPVALTRQVAANETFQIRIIPQ